MINLQPQKQVIVKRKKDGAYLSIPERDLYSTLKQGFEFVANDIDTVGEMKKLFGDKPDVLIKKGRGRPKKNA